MFCYFYTKAELKELLSENQFIRMRKLTLFKSIYWKISKLKFGVQFKRAVQKIKNALQERLTTEQYEKMMKYDRYIKKGKTMLFSKSFDDIDLDNIMKADSLLEKKNKNRKRLSFLHFLDKKAKKNVAIKDDVDFYLLQKVREASLSDPRSILQKPLSPKLKIEQPLKEEIAQLKSELQSLSPPLRENKHIQDLEIIDENMRGDFQEQMEEDKSNSSRKFTDPVDNVKDVWKSSLKIPLPQPTKKIEQDIKPPEPIQPSDKLPCQQSNKGSQGLSDDDDQKSAGSASVKSKDPFIAQTLQGLEKNFHILIKKAEMMEVQKQLNPKKLMEILEDRSTDEEDIDNKLFVLFLENYFYNHSVLKTTLKISERELQRSVRKAIKFIDQEDSHLIPEDIAMDTDIESYLKEQKKPHYPGSQQGTVNLLAVIGQEGLIPIDDSRNKKYFLDEERSSVDSENFPINNADPAEFANENLLQTIAWLEVKFFHSEQTSSCNLESRSSHEKN